MFKWLTRFFNGSVSSTPVDWKNRSVVTTAATGVNITETSALTIPAFLHGIRLYGQVLGSCNFNLVKQLDTGGTEIARAHDVHKLLRDEPNEFQTSVAFWETLIGHACVWGNGFAYIDRANVSNSAKYSFRPTALLPLLPDRTYVKRERGQVSYVTIVDGQKVELSPYDVFHLPGFGFDGLQGISLVKLMKDTLGLTKAQENFYSAFFGNGMNTGGFIHVPSALPDSAIRNFKDSMEKVSGLGSAFKYIYLEDGFKFERNATNPQEAEGVAARSFQLGDMARIVGLAPHLLYDLSRSTNNNIEHQGIEAVNYSFRPWARRLEQEANRKLLYESEKFAYRCVVDLTPLTAGDSKTQADVDEADFRMLALTPNERRTKQGRNPIDTPEMNEPYVNAAILPLSIAIKKALQAGTTTPQAIAAVVAEATPNAPTANEEPPADTGAGDKETDGQPGPETPPQLAEDSDARAFALREGSDARVFSALRPILDDVAARVARREYNAVNRIIERNKDEAKRQQLITEYVEESRAVVSSMLSPAVMALRSFNANVPELEEIVTAFFSETTRDGISGAINEDSRKEKLINQFIQGKE
mgnify:CR=1 FL=1